ncbi:MAG: glycosyltransferase [Verrucomicrobiota bacterium]
MKRVILVTPYFLPSNLAGVQRVRLMSRSLKDNGWNPTIVTVDHRYYEERNDLASLRLLPDDLAIERVTAWPARMCRPIGIGDISLRAQFTLRRRVGELIQKLRPSLIFTTVLPGYTGLIGAWAKRRFNIPFVLDYQDPWVPKVARVDARWTKAGIADRLARWLEPKMLRQVDGLTAVSDETLDTLRSRNLIDPKIPIEIIPIGADREDHAIAKQFGNSFIKREPETFHIAYVGTLTKKMLPALEGVLAAVRKAQTENEKKNSIHLIGTSAQPDGKDQHDLTALFDKHALRGCVQLHPARVGYLDALRTMQDADLLLLLGSTDSHYTASKLFPYWLSGKPVLGLFHEASTIVSLSRELGDVSLVLYNDKISPQIKVNETAHLISQILKGERSMSHRNENAFAPFSSEGIAARYARFFDKVCQQCA